jgi:hypothetical protein
MEKEKEFFEKIDNLIKKLNELKDFIQCVRLEQIGNFIRKI